MSPGELMAAEHLSARDQAEAELLYLYAYWKTLALRRGATGETEGE